MKEKELERPRVPENTSNAIAHAYARESDRYSFFDEQYLLRK